MEDAPVFRYFYQQEIEIFLELFLVTWLDHDLGLPESLVIMPLALKHNVDGLLPRFPYESPISEHEAHFLVKVVVCRTTEKGLLCMPFGEATSLGSFPGHPRLDFLGYKL